MQKKDFAVLNTLESCKNDTESSHIGRDFYMAEKYGVVPKRFTKAWWSYFWMYYKVHTIAAAFAVICVAVTAYQCSTAPKYDLNVTFTGKNGYTEDMQNALNEVINQYTEDIDGNGEKSAFLQQLIISDKNEDAQYNYAMQTKLVLEFQNNCSFLFMMDSAMAEQLMNSESLDGAFIPVNEWADSEVDDSLLYKVNDIPYAVNLKNSAALKNAGVDCEDIYIAICINNKDDEINVKAFENSKQIINALIQQ